MNKGYTICKIRLNVSFIILSNVLLFSIFLKNLSAINLILIYFLFVSILDSLLYVFRYFTFP